MPGRGENRIMPKKPKRIAAAPERPGAGRSAHREPPPGIPAVDTVATLRELRKATHHTQDDLAHAMGVGQGTISRIEKRHDMLVSTLQHYVESMGGTLQIVAVFPDRPPLRVERLGKKAATPSRASSKKPAGPGRPAPE